MILLHLLFNLRSQGLKVGLGEWLELLRGLELGLAEDLNGLYFLARSLLVLIMRKDKQPLKKSIVFNAILTHVISQSSYMKENA